MNQKELLREIKSLPPDAYRELLDFIAFLRVRYRTHCKRDGSIKTDLANEPFVGIWRDRVDMENAGSWVRKTREQEWTRS